MLGGISSGVVGNHKCSPYDQKIPRMPINPLYNVRYYHSPGFYRISVPLHDANRNTVPWIVGLNYAFRFQCNKADPSEILSIRHNSEFCSQCRRNHRREGTTRIRNVRRLIDSLLNPLRKWHLAQIPSPDVLSYDCNESNHMLA